MKWVKRLLDRIGNSDSMIWVYEMLHEYRIIKQSLIEKNV